MKRWLTVFCCWLALGQAFAQPESDVVSVWSATRQFHAVGRRNSGLPISVAEPGGAPGVFVLNPVYRPATGSKLTLNPALLVTSCERIKQALLLTLEQRDEWHGVVDLVVNPALPENQSPMPIQRLDRNGWDYELDFPAHIESKYLLRSIVGVLLMESANRGAGSQPAEVPVWIAAGLSARLEAEDLDMLVLRPESHYNPDERIDPRLDPLRRQFQNQPALTFQELSWPAAGELVGTNFDSYSASARLFVQELLAFKDGRACLRDFLAQLPRYRNWQTAFLHAFSAHFAGLLDVEKWWALVSVNYTDSDYASRYGPRESWQRLQRALDVPAEVHFSPDHLPTPIQINLQDIINTWTPDQTTASLQRVAENLLLLRPRLDPGLDNILDGYLGVIRGYLYDTGRDKIIWASRNPSAELAPVRRSACKQLDALDVQRDHLRTQYLSQGEPVRATATRDAISPTPLIHH